MVAARPVLSVLAPRLFAVTADVLEGPRAGSAAPARQQRSIICHTTQHRALHIAQHDLSHLSHLPGQGSPFCAVLMLHVCVCVLRVPAAGGHGAVQAGA
jgi:hypothetical protein